MQNGGHIQDGGLRGERASNIVAQPPNRFPGGANSGLQQCESAVTGLQERVKRSGEGLLLRGGVEYGGKGQVSESPGTPRGGGRPRDEIRNKFGVVGQ